MAAAASTSWPSSSSSSAVPFSPAKQGTSASATGPAPLSASSSSASLLLQNAGSFRIRAPVTADTDSSDFDSDFSDGSTVAADDGDEEGFETEGSVLEEGDDAVAETPDVRPLVAKVVVKPVVAQLSMDEDEDEDEVSDVSDGENGVVVARVPSLERKARVRVSFLEIREEEEEGREVDDELSDSRTVIGAPSGISGGTVNVADFESSLDDGSGSGSGSAVVDESSEAGNHIPEVQDAEAASMVIIEEQISEEKVSTADEADAVEVEYSMTTVEQEVQEMVAESSGENMGFQQNESDSGKAVEEEEEEAIVVVVADAGSATRPNYQSLELAENGGGIEGFKEREVEEGEKFLLSDPDVSKDLSFEDCSSDSHTMSSEIPDLEVDSKGTNRKLELPDNGGIEVVEEVVEGEKSLLSDPDVNKDLTFEDCSSDPHTTSGQIADMELGTRSNQSLELSQIGNTESLEEEVESKKLLLSDADVEDSTFKAFEGFSDSQTNNGQIADMKIETGIEVRGKELFESDGSRSSSFTISSSDVSRGVSPAWSADTGSSFDGISPLPANSGTKRLVEDEKKNVFQKNQHLIVKLLMLIDRLGCSPRDPIAAQVMYNLSGGCELSFESSERLAMEVVAEGRDNLDFSLNILVIGKTGVGKSSTINSIFGEKKVSIDAFEPATTIVNEVSGTVNGIRIRILDTPGLTSSFKDASTNRKILSSVKKLMKKFPPDVVLYVDRLDDVTGDETADVTLLRQVTKFLTPSVWDNAIVVLTHASSLLPPEEDGPLSFEGFVARRCYGIHHAISLAVGDQLLVHPGNWKPVALAENQKEKNWTAQLLLTCCSVKILSQASGISKIPNDRAPRPRLSNESGGDLADSDVEAVKKKSIDSVDSSPLPEIFLPPSFRYRALEPPTPRILVRPGFDMTEWDHDCGYDDGVTIANQFPSAFSLHLTKDKNHFNLHLESSAHNRSTTMAGFDINTTIRGETKAGNFKVNKAAARVSIAMLDSTMATAGMELINGESRSNLSVLKWKGDFGLIASLQTEMDIGRGNNVGVSVWMNDKSRGRIRFTSSRLELQFAIMEIVPVVMAVFGRFCSGGSSIRN